MRKPGDQTFLQAIVEEPDERLPRLIYADFLEEQGDLRGEFIRVQCELADLKDSYDTQSVPYLGLKERETELLDDYREDWEAGLQAAFKGAEGYHVEGIFRRGMLEGVQVLPGTRRKDGEEAQEEETQRPFPMRDFLDRLNRLMDIENGAEPTIREISFYSDNPEHVPQAENEPEEENEEQHHYVTVPLTDRMTRLMADSFHLSNIHRITRLNLLEQNEISNTAVNALTNSRSPFRNLEELRFSCDDLAESYYFDSLTGRPIYEGMRALSRLYQLRVLDLGNHMTVYEDQIRELTAYEGRLPKLESLTFRQAVDNNHALSFLYKHPAISKHLKHLTVYDSGASFVSDIRSFENLESLKMVRPQLDSSDVAALSQCKHLQNLEFSQPRSYGLSGVYPLELAPLFEKDSELRNLHALTINGPSPQSPSRECGMTGYALTKLAERDCPVKNLQHLSLTHCYMDSADHALGLQRLMNSNLANGLRTLVLNADLLSNTALEELIGSSFEKKLERLEYSSNHFAIENETFARLCHSRMFPNLSHLGLTARETPFKHQPFLSMLAQPRREIHAGDVLFGGLPKLSAVSLSHPMTPINVPNGPHPYPHQFLTFTPPAFNDKRYKPTDKAELDEVRGNGKDNELPPIEYT